MLLSILNTLITPNLFLIHDNVNKYQCTVVNFDPKMTRFNWNPMINFSLEYQTDEEGLNVMVLGYKSFLVQEHKFFGWKR